MTDPAPLQPPEEWKEIWRGPRRAAQVIVRHFRDGGLTSRDQRGLPGFTVKPGDLVVLVAAADHERAVKVFEVMRKNFPEVFSPTPRGKGPE